ncbi:hypothetical protein GCM10011504_41080 [Siccirubricoccus deserti]|nr:hypothetical protein GCM10011504_41080 [Siccirubricoccus deserti]
METGPARTLEAAERIRRQMVARPLRPADGKKPRVTLLVGVATFHGHPDYTDLANAAGRRSTGPSGREEPQHDVRRNGV